MNANDFPTVRPATDFTMVKPAADSINESNSAASMTRTGSFEMVTYSEAPRRRRNSTIWSNISATTSIREVIEGNSSAVRYKDTVILIPNGGYGWIIVLASFFVQFFIVGSMNSFGVFFPVYISSFNSSAGNVAWVSSLTGAFFSLIGGYAGKLSDRYGNARIVLLGALISAIGYVIASFSTSLWHLYVTLGFISGVGFSFAYVAGVSVVGEWFTTKRALAIGTSVAGGGVGQFAFSMIAGLLINMYGWRTALQILAVIILGGLMMVSPLIKRLHPLQMPRKRTGTITSILQDSLRYENISKKAIEVKEATKAKQDYFHDKNFIFMYLSALFAVMGLVMPFVCVTQFAEIQGLSTSDAVFIVSIMGIGSAVGRVLMGLSADTFGSLRIYQLCTFASSVSTFCWLFCTTYITLILYVVIFGFFCGGYYAVFPSVAAELFGLDDFGSIFGVLLTSNFIGSLLSAPVGGILFDTYQTYTPSILVAGSFILAGFVITLFITPVIRKPKEPTKDRSESILDVSNSLHMVNVVGASSHSTENKAPSISSTPYEEDRSNHVPFRFRDTSIDHDRQDDEEKNEISIHNATDGYIEPEDPYSFKFGAFEDYGTYKFAMVQR